MTRWDSKKKQKTPSPMEMEDSVKKVRGLLEALGLEKKIKIA